MKSVLTECAVQPERRGVCLGLGEEGPRKGILLDGRSAGLGEELGVHQVKKAEIQKTTCILIHSPPVCMMDSTWQAHQECLAVCMSLHYSNQCRGTIHSLSTHVMLNMRHFFKINILICSLKIFMLHRSTSAQPWFFHRRLFYSLL